MSSRLISFKNFCYSPLTNVSRAALAALDALCVKMTKKEYKVITTWKPLTLELSSDVRKQLDNKIIRIIENGVRQMEPGNQEEVVIGRLREISQDYTHPYLYQLAYTLKEKSGRKISLQEIEILVELTSASKERISKNTTYYGIPLDDRWDDEADLTVSSRAISNLNEANTEDRDFIFNAVPIDDWKSALRKAINVLLEHYPSFVPELSVAVKIVATFECDKAISFSDIQSFGTIFARTGYTTDPYRLAEVLVHEGSHSTLNCIAAAQPLLNNGPEEQFYTPLRPDPRPMYGLFHQMYVLIRLRDFYASIPQSYTGIEATLRSISKNLHIACDTIQAHALLTDTGATIFNSIKASIGR